jgi:gluconolactonase
MTEWDFEMVAGPFDFTEGPAWDGSGLVFSDIPNSRLLRYDPATGETQVVRDDTNEGNGLMFDRHGVLYACEGGPGGRCIARYEGDTRTVVVDRFESRRLNSPNDLAFDTEGRLWFTDPRYGDKTDDLELDHQSVYRLDPEDDGWSIHRVTFDTLKPNGLLVTPDGATLYVAESAYGDDNPRELRAYPLDGKGNVSGPYEVPHNFYPHRGIDGMCLDVVGNVVATSGWEPSGPGPMIHVFAPSGRVLETHPVPKVPTNCTWGDDDLQSLYVTAGGCLFRARTERRGYLVYPPAAGAA